MNEFRCFGILFRVIVAQMSQLIRSIPMLRLYSLVALSADGLIIQTPLWNVVLICFQPEVLPDNAFRTLLFHQVHRVAGHFDYTCIYGIQCACSVSLVPII